MLKIIKRQEIFYSNLELKKDNDPDLAIRFEIVDNGNGLLVNETDFFDSIKMNDSFHLDSVKRMIDVALEHLNGESHWFGFEYKIIHPFSKNASSYIGFRYKTDMEFREFIERIRELLNRNIN